MQFPPNTDPELEKALTASSRKVSGYLEFDWNRDGLFNHGYSDLTDIAQQVQDSRTIQGDLPEDVSLTSGYSSGELTITLGGALTGSPFKANRLLSPYESTSPLITFRKEGTPVRYSRIVETSVGTYVIPQFTGWIREYNVDDEMGTVRIICSDVLDLMSKLTSLPHWAIGPKLGANSSGFVLDTNASWMRPISTTWVYEEILRDAGRPTGPAPRADCIHYTTMNGSMLPSIGNIAETQRGSWHRVGFLPNTDSWVDGKYGLMNQSYVYAPGTYMYATDYACYSRAITRAYVSANGTGDGPTYVGMGLWAYCKGPTAGFDSSSLAGVQLDVEEPTPLDVAAGGPSIILTQDGQLVARVYDDSLTGGGDFNFTWQFTVPQSQGYHYYNVLWSFTNNSINATLTIDDVPQTWTVVTKPSRGYKYNGYAVPAVYRGSRVTVNTSQTQIQHVQIYYGNGSGTYLPSQKLPPTNNVGEPLAQVERSMTELTWIPDVYKRPAWEVLKEAVSAEFGVIHTTETGQLRIIRRDTVWYATGVDVTDAYPIPMTTLKNIQLNPSADSYRNTLSISSSNRQQIPGIIWTPETGTEFFIPKNTAAPIVKRYPIQDAVSVRIPPKYVFSTNASTYPPGKRFDVSTVQAVNQALPTQYSNGSWDAAIDYDPDQRTVLITAQNTSNTIDHLIGTLPKSSGNEEFQPGFFVAGNKYGDVEVIRDSFNVPSEVTARGVYLLELPDSNWRQTPSVSDTLQLSLLRDLPTPAPTINDVRIPADPRFQLLDVVSLETISAGKVFAQIIGITRNDTKDTSEDTLKLRVLYVPNEWQLGITGVSELDLTTTLA